MMRALVTNDDGINSPGLHALARVARDADLEVLIAAPTADRSGASASLSAMEDEGRVVIHPHRVPELPDIQAVAVQAAPAFIVQAAMTGALGPPPDVVVSGINIGVNTGHAILHSGTVGAAFTAATHGRPGLAVSVAAATGPRFDTAVLAAAPALDWLCRSAGTPVLNVNVPDCAPSAIKGLRRARLARFGAVEARVRERGEGWVTFTYADVEAEHEAGTDAALLAAGYACYTVLEAVREGDAAGVEELDGWQPDAG